MSKMNNNGESGNSELKKEYEAYKTLQDWVKTVPKTMKELEKNACKDLVLVLQVVVLEMNIRTVGG